MKKRTREILIEIIKSEEITISQLAESFDVSERTIRNDLNDINDFLQENDLSMVSIGSKKKIQHEEDIKEAMNLIGDKDFYSYKLSKEERKSMIAMLLIESSEYITLSKIADTLFVSRATIINDLGGVKEYLKSGNLKVISHANKGLRLEGAESDKRFFLLNIITADRNNINLFTRLNKDNVLFKEEMDKIHKIVNEQEHAHESYLTDSSYNKLKNYLAIAISRIGCGELIEAQQDINNSKYAMAQDILKYMSQYLGVMSTVDEVGFLSKFLNSLRYLKKQNENKSMVKVQLITRTFIEAVSDELKINLNNDYDFYQNLSNHLESIFRSGVSDLQSNEFLDEVVIKNPDIVLAVKKHIDIIEKYAERTISEIEITYITIHICAAMERKKNQEISFHVVVVCSGGIGTSQLLLAKLKSHYNFQIVDIISSHDEKNILESHADLIISTVPLNNVNVDYVIVSPLFSDEDYLKVGTKIDEIRNKRNIPPRIEAKEITAKGVLNKLKSVFIEFEGQLPPGLQEKVTEAINDYFDDGAQMEEINYIDPYLHHLLPSTHIELDVECSDWRDAIRKSAQYLLDNDYIEEGYIDKMIENVVENGPYVVISEGFALPHEGLNSGTKKIGMNLIRLKEPIDFGDGEDAEKGVKFVCCLSAIDHKSHLKAFFNLVNMLGQEKFKTAIENANSEYELAEIIRKYEYSI